jgi:hypothetical protein
MPRTQDTLQAQAECTCNNGWCLVGHLYDKRGVGVLCFLFIAYIFYRMVWKVWSAAIKAKDEEIERILSERNDLQSLL